MDSFVSGIPITPDTVKNAYLKYYPNQFNASSKYNLLNLFGIRVSTSDSSQPDDYLGAIRLNSGYSTLDKYEIVVCRASLEPAPNWVVKPFDAEARRKGGAAFLREGQHIYKFYTPSETKDSWRQGGNCSFCPTTPPSVYRWRPNQTEINLWRQNKAPITSNFERDLIDAQRKNFRNSRVFLSDSTDTCIHKAWKNRNLTTDSAGCQVVIPDDLDKFRIICRWAQDHINKRYGNSFVYTLFNKDQFVRANTGRATSFLDIFNWF